MFSKHILLLFPLKEYGFEEEIFDTGQLQQKLFVMNVTNYEMKVNNLCSNTFF